MQDFEAARDRVLMGQRRESLVLSEAEKERVAFHEGGHAVLAYVLEHADPVHKVTILPTGMALGVTQQLPIEERHIYPREVIEDSLAVRMGGRAAELLVYGDLSTGASNDLVGNTELARKMVREWGMSEELGPMAWGSQGMVFLGEDLMHSRDYSEDTARVVDAEVVPDPAPPGGTGRRAPEPTPGRARRRRPGSARARDARRRRGRHAGRHRLRRTGPRRRGRGRSPLRPLGSSASAHAHGRRRGRRPGGWKRWQRGLCRADAGHRTDGLAGDDGLAGGDAGGLSGVSRPEGRDSRRRLGSRRARRRAPAPPGRSRPAPSTRFPGLIRQRS